MDHPPPPPYSETDIYSDSGSRSSIRPHPVITSSATASSDNNSIPGQPTSEHDAASSTGDPTIYTPPYTPDGDISSHLDSVTDGFDNTFPPASAMAASALDYFESRPVHHLSTDVLLVHRIIITERTQPSDIPFPKPEKMWLEREVLPQDWETFVNYLIPHHTDATNRDVAERKLNAELVDERMHRLTLDRTDTSRTDLRQVDAQLRPLRQSHTEETAYHDAKTVIDQWNEGFFKKRATRIEASEPQAEIGEMEMPGSWTNHPDEEIADGPGQAPPCTSRRGFGGGWLRADRSGFHMGRLSADENGFRIGNFLVADNNGFRLGPIRADAQGFLSNQQHAPHENHRGFRRGYRRGFHPDHHPVHMPTNFRGRRSAQEFSSSVPQRDRSRSTSSSSSSSASSIESAGSLPDYDHLKDTQLPVARQAIKDWLNHPEQPITRQTVKQISQEIKAAKCERSNSTAADRDALRIEVRELFKEFKAAKKRQAKTWKAAKRQRKHLRREAKRLRKAARREVKQADKDVRYAEREAKKVCKKEVNAGKMPGSTPAAHNTPGAWPEENGPPNQFSMSPPIGPTSEVRCGGSTGNAHAAYTAKATLLQAEARQLEAEAKREEALRRAEETRQESLEKESMARSRAEESRHEAEAKAAIARENAQVIPALAREKAEKHRQKATATARLARQKSEADHILADSDSMQADVNRLRIQADHLRDDAKLRLLDVAEKLEEEAKRLKKKGEKLVAEAMQSSKNLASTF